MPLSDERLKVLEKQVELESLGLFNQDCETDPPSREILPNEVDYLKKKFLSKIKTKYAYFIARRFLNRSLRKQDLIVKEIKNIENFDNVKTGAIITCNHFNAMDSFSIQMTYEKSIHNRKKRFYRIIKEGNYTSFPGFFGFLMRNCYTLPLSSNKETLQNFLKSVDIILQSGDFVLIYPEQSMWWNYKKPKPLKKTAFKFAAKNNVPVIPCFVTLEDSNKLSPDGSYVQEYTVHVGEAIYPLENLSLKDNIEQMKNLNYNQWKETYEKVYNEKLVYNIKKEV